MLTPADFLTQIEGDESSAPPSSFNPSSTQTFDFQGKPKDNDSDQD